MMHIPDNEDLFDQEEVEQEKSRRLHKRIGILERMEDAGYDTVRIDGTV